MGKELVHSGNLLPLACSAQRASGVEVIDSANTMMERCFKTDACFSNKLDAIEGGLAEDCQAFSFALQPSLLKGSLFGLVKMLFM